MPSHDEAVLGRPRSSAPSAAQAVDDGRDPVGLLAAQLLGAADDRLALGEAAEQRDQRQLVDRQRDLVAARPSVPAQRRRAATSSVADRLAAGASRSALEPPTSAAHPLEDAQEAGARRVDAHARRATISRARHEQRRRR